MTLTVLEPSVGFLSISLELKFS